MTFKQGVRTGGVSGIYREIQYEKLKSENHEINTCEIWKLLNPKIKYQKN